MTEIEKARRIYAEALDEERYARDVTVAAVHYACGSPHRPIDLAEVERLAAEERARGWAKDARLLERCAAHWRRATEARILAGDRLYAAGGGQP